MKQQAGGGHFGSSWKVPHVVGQDARLTLCDEGLSHANDR